MIIRASVIIIIQVSYSSHGEVKVVEEVVLSLLGEIVIDIVVKWTRHVRSTTQTCAAEGSLHVAPVCADP